jgi:alkylation response protein AidB-like acyl-CoA dehydrogenase
MDFGLNEEQEMLQKSAREFLSNEYSDKVLKEMARDQRGCTPELWKKMADLGWTALSIPEEYGGIGDFLDLILVLQEMGRAGLISPYFSSIVLGASTVMIAGNKEQKLKYLPALAEGKTIFTVAILEEFAHYIPQAIQLLATAHEGGFILQGRKLFVTDACSADYLVCAARTGETIEPQGGVTLFIVDARAAGITSILLQTISPDKQGEVIFDNVKVPRENVLGEIDNGWPILEKIMEKAAVARCAEMVGGSERVLDMTITYAKDRTAFGHPIGAYQSIQHRCADMLIDIESSKYATYQAAWRLSAGLPAAKEVAVAKSWVSQAFRRVVTSAHQVHGAIGFTEDHVLHWFTRRARAQEVSYGDADFHLEKLTILSKQKPIG